MYTIQKISFILLLLTLSVYSCTEKIQLELDEGETHIVIEAAVSNSIRNQVVRITRSSPYYDSLPAQPVSGAIVTISDSSNIYNLVEIQSGVYVTSIIFGGIPGQQYELTVEIDGQYFEASSVMPRVPTIDSIRFIADDEDSQLFHIGLFAQENPLPGDFYFWGVFKDFIYQSNNITMLNYASDELINGSYFNGNSVQSVNSGLGNKITLQMASIPKDYFNYSVSVLKETVYNGGIFETAPANIQGNISNGALGFFFAYSETFKTQIIKIEE